VAENTEVAKVGSSRDAEVRTALREGAKKGSGWVDRGSGAVAARVEVGRGLWARALHVGVLGGSKGMTRVVP